MARTESFGQRLTVSRAAVSLNEAFEQLARYKQTSDHVHLARAVQSCERARSLLERVTSGPPWHPLFPVVLAHLSHCYRTRYELNGATGDLDASITCAQQALIEAPDHEMVLAFNHNLGLSLLARFERTQDLRDVDRAIEVYTPYIEQSAASAERAAHLANFSHIYRARHARTNNLADLETAISLAQQALDMVGNDDSHAVFVLGALAVGYKARFGFTSDIDDLDRSIELCEQAVAALPATHVLLPGQWSNLAMEYLTRFAFKGALADIDRAVELARAAAARTSRAGLDHSVYANNVGIVLRRRGERLDSLADLREAIEAGEDAVASIPRDHSDRPRWLTNLGSAYRALYERVGDSALIERSLDAFSTACDVAPTDYPERAWWLVNMAIVRILRHRETADREDLDSAVTLCRQAMSDLPDEHPNQLRAFTVLFDALLKLVETTGTPIDPIDLRRGVEAVEHATPPSAYQRVRLGHVLGELAMAVGDFAVAVRALDHAVAALPAVAAYELARADQEDALATHSGLVGDAIVAHLRNGDLEGAIVAAEHGRAVLFSAALDARSDLTDLDDRAPDLSTRLRAVRAGLDDRSESVPQTELRVRWAAYGRLLAQIRAMPGLERFLLPPTFEQLRHAAAGGYVVVVNAAQAEGHAVIISAGAAPELVALPGLRRGEAYSWARRLRSATQDPSAGSSARETVAALLSWLWDTVVEAIADALPPGVISRVWWMPVGPLATMPLHAAGHPGANGALDVMVSSYIPTLRALIVARGRRRPASRRLMTVAMPTTPGMPHLPGTVAESEALAAHLTASQELSARSATVGEVTRGMADCNWVHFACHASTDPAVPSNGGLHLHDGKLSINAVHRLRLESAEMAYLSACSTANTAVRHADESVHLASAFHLAGFRHVVAALWPVDDMLAARAAEAFYTNLPDEPSSDAPAAALHLVAHELRAAHRDSPHLWAPLVHSGP
ncbi:CHAT domain-containing protein [Nocardia sp. NPDC050712]|uniref:CHAT domain-containing protein n=1 Tax=Nocardia sp. NPDC050712 TaxID=3155518 RepID=UPI0033C53754